MALHICMKQSALKCLEAQLWKTAIPCLKKNFPYYSVPSSPSISQRRCYRTFSRRPIGVKHTKEDQGKMLLDEYLEKTSATVNEEVLKEAEMIAKITQTKGNSNLRTKNPPDGEEDEVYDQETPKKDFSKGNEDSLKYFDASFLKNQRYNNEDGDAFEEPRTRDVSRRRYVNPDPLISKAVKAIRSEPFSKAFGQYRSLLQQCSSPKMRSENDLVLLEGPKLIREALESGLEPIAFYQSRQKLLLDMMPKGMSLQEKVDRIRTFKTFQTPFNKLSTWSSVVKGQGLLGVFRLSEAASAPRLRLNEEGAPQVAAVTPVTIVLDGVKEPGNLGAIIRTVAAIGAHHVVLMKGCCDPWEGKALRAGCGAHFSLRISRNVPWNSVYGFVPSYPNVFVADVCNSDREAMKTPDSDDGYLEEEYDERDEQDAEEERGHDQQDGVARRDRDQDRKMKLSSKEGLELEGSGGDDTDDKTGVVVGIDEEGREVLIDNSFNDEEHVSEFSNVKIPTKYYNEHVYYPSNLKKNVTPSVVLVIGSEAGLSNYAKKFTLDNFGQQVSVPLHGGMDSLNTSVASGIILYEIWNQARKQLQADEQTVEQ